MVGADLEGLTADLDRLSAPTTFAKVEDFLAAINPLADAPGAERARERIGALDQALTQIAENEGPERAARQLGLLADAAGLNGDELTRLQSLLPEFNTAIDTAAVSSSAAAGAAGELGGALGPIDGMIEEVGSAAEDAVDPIDAFSGAVRTAIGLLLGVAEAEIGWEQALDDVVETIKESTKVLDENGDVVGEQAASLDRSTQAGRDNERAIIGAVEAAAAHGQALMEEGGSAEDAASAIAGHIDQLRQELVDAGLAEDAVDNLLESYGATPDQIYTAIIANTAEAEAALDRLAAKLSQVTGTGYVRVVGGSNVVPRGVNRHSGGMVDDSGPWQSAANLGPQERLIIGEVGERVVTAKDWAALMSMVPRYHDGGQIGASLLNPGGPVGPVDVDQLATYLEGVLP